MNLSSYGQPRARSSDPITSHEAAERAKAFAGTHAERILAALEEMGSGIAPEIGLETGLSVVQVDRRVAELERAGKVRVLMYAGKPLIRDGFRVLARVAE